MHDFFRNYEEKVATNLCWMVKYLKIFCWNHSKLETIEDIFYEQADDGVYLTQQDTSVYAHT